MVNWGLIENLIRIMCFDQGHGTKYSDNVYKNSEEALINYLWGKDKFTMYLKMDEFVFKVFYCSSH